MHEDSENEHYRAIEKLQIKILVIVLGNGYLETAGMEALRRPTNPTIYADLPSYIERGRLEEIEFLKNVVQYGPDLLGKKRIPYIMTVINKMDVWFEDREAVLAHYGSGEIHAAITALGAKWGQSGVQPTQFPVSCIYNSFQGYPPSGKMSAEAARVSMYLLRAQILLRLMEKRV